MGAYLQISSQTYHPDSLFHCVKHCHSIIGNEFVIILFVTPQSLTPYFDSVPVFNSRHVTRLAGMPDRVAWLKMQSRREVRSMDMFVGKCLNAFVPLMRLVKDSSLRRGVRLVGAVLPKDFQQEEAASPRSFTQMSQLEERPNALKMV